MKVLIVLYHHRENSLTYELKSQFEKGLKDSGHEVDTLDLYKMKFNPILEGEDEPQWLEPEQHPSEEVTRKQERLLKYHAIAFVFPMYWWSMPAMLKGYIERVWNFDFAHGNHIKLNLKKCLWMPLTGAPEEIFAKYKYDEMVERYFNVAIANYCGIKDSKLRPFYKAIRNTPEGVQKLIEQAYQEGLNFSQC